MRPAYGVSSGPSIVAVQERRLPSAEGNAEMPGAEEVMSCINSVCKLPLVSLVVSVTTKGRTVSWCSEHLGLFVELQA